MQVATTMGDTRLLDPNIYNWGRAGLESQLKSNITQLSYSLARASDPNARLSDFDVQVQIDRITAGYQSKSSMTSALVEVHNQLIKNMETSFKTAKRNDMPGTTGTFEQYLESVGTNYLIDDKKHARTGNNLVGFWVTIRNPDGTPVLDEKGKPKRKFRVIAEWAGN